MRGGKQLEETATAGEAMSAGGLDWREKLVPIQTEKALSKRISRRMAVMRDDLKSGDPKSVLGLVYPGFRPLQNRAVGVFDKLLGHG